MIGLYIFGVLVLAGLLTFIVVKVKWSRQAALKWTTTTTGHLNSDIGLIEGPGLNAYRYEG
jgi:hypothetical protein